METGDTIVALGTPPGIGAIALIRVSGPRAGHVVARHLASAQRFGRAAPNTVHLYRFVDERNAEVIDEITAIRYRAPRSFTGEEMVEILCHGGATAPRRILEALVRSGARYAAPGEFTRRAFHHGKTNLARAESIHQIVTSVSVIQQKNAIANYLGAFEPQLRRWKETIVEMAAVLESGIEFGEEDEAIAQSAGLPAIGAQIRALEEEMRAALAARKAFARLEAGLNVALVGPRNAGKSSIFNLIVGYERSIVDPQEGTTRDFITEDRLLDGVRIRFIDTAGLDGTAAGVERKGVERSRELLQSAQALVWVSAANEEKTPEEAQIEKQAHAMILGVVNKIDLADSREKETMFARRNIPCIAISALRREERDRLESFILGQLKSLGPAPDQTAIIGTARQEKIVAEIADTLAGMQELTPQEEVVAAHLCREILRLLDEFSGATTTDAILDTVFNEFCVGK